MVVRENSINDLASAEWAGAELVWSSPRRRCAQPTCELGMARALVAALESAISRTPSDNATRVLPKPAFASPHAHGRTLRQLGARIDGAARPLPETRRSDQWLVPALVAARVHPSVVRGAFGSG